MTSKRRRYERSVAAVVAMLALGYIFLSTRLPLPAIVDPVGPRVFPILVGVGLLVSAGLLYLETLAAGGRASTPLVANTESDPVPASRHGLAPVLIVLGLTLAYYLVFERLGYLVSTAIYLFVMLAVFNRGRRWLNLTIAVFGSVVLYLIFSTFLQVPLPPGLLSL